jgi:hypothetical protein
VRRVVLVTVAVLVAVGAAALLARTWDAGTSAATRDVVRDGLSFRAPDDWHATGFSTTNDPHRLAIASYPVGQGDVEGDCGGHAAVAKLPADGVIVVLIDHHGSFYEGSSAPYRPPPGRFSRAAGAYAQYECFGASTMYRFRIGAHDLQAHLAVGNTASDTTIDEGLAILDSLRATG